MPRRRGYLDPQGDITTWVRFPDAGKCTTTDWMAWVFQEDHTHVVQKPLGLQFPRVTWFIRMNARNAAAILTLLATLPLAAKPGTPDAALVDLEVELNGERVFTPHLLVGLGRMSEALLESPSGEGHRVILAVTRHEDVYTLRSLYLTKAGDERWVVQAEPGLSFLGDDPASATITDETGAFRLHLNVRVGDAVELRSRLRGETGTFQN
ncbi:MAG: hypothetical protein OXI90_13165 [Gammaproteobacteria bacterium]|nr:hypothetical protein [Gammaproteobacteria bacterium]